MKSAYEIAMEKLEQSAPTRKLSTDQLTRIHELDNTYKARIAERETFLQSQIAAVQAKGDHAELEMIEKQLQSELARLREEWEDKKRHIREEQV